MELWDELEPEILVYENKKKETKKELEYKMQDNALQKQINKQEVTIKRLEEGQKYLTRVILESNHPKIEEPPSKIKNDP